LSPRRDDSAVARIDHAVISIVGARYTGVIVAASAILLDEDCAYFWLSGFDPLSPITEHQINCATWKCCEWPQVASRN